jgi:2-succinyl-6-hydroxy-2,4-cyclohexadiene-1-carboxylate synthase
MTLVHGFTQTGASWAPVVERLDPGFHVTMVDAPGHGGSATCEADLWEAGRMVLQAAATGGPGRPTLVGYSMGGRIALHAALAQPGSLERLVLVSATAGIEDPGERAARVASDEALAQRIEAEGVAAFVEWWLRLPLFATLPAGAAALDSRLTNTAPGLASSLRRAGTGRQEPLWDRLPSIEVPVLVVAGALDPVYRARAERLAKAIPGAELAIIDQAGHACHLERPDEFAEVLTRFAAP